LFKNDGTQRNGTTERNATRECKRILRAGGVRKLWSSKENQSLIVLSVTS